MGDSGTIKRITDLDVFLKENGFEKNKMHKKNRDGETAVTLAIKHNKSLEFISGLIDAGAQVSSTGALGVSPIELALQDNNPDLSLFLLKNNADRNKVVGDEKRLGSDGKEHTYWITCSDKIAALAKSDDSWKEVKKYLDENKDKVLVPPAPIENLVLEGGGAKGLVYVGAMQSLEENGVLPGVKRVAGSSAGGITALLIALGYSLEDLKAEMLETDFTKWMDSGNPLSTEHSPEDGWFTWMRKKAQNAAAAVAEPFVAGYNFLWDSSHGAYTGEAFRRWAIEKITTKLGHDATFADLHAMCGTDARFKELYLTGTNLTTNRTEVFSYENTPNMKLSDAVRITMSFPGAFQAYPMTKEDGSVHYYADGGMKDNYPMHIFDNADHLPEGYGFTDVGTNPATMGFKVDSATECDDIIWNKPKGDDSKGVGLFSWIRKKLIGGVRASDKYDVATKYGQNTVQIYDEDISTLEFSLSEEKKQRLIKSGKEATDAKIDAYHRGVVLETGDAKKPIAQRPELDRRASKGDLQELEFKLAVERERALQAELEGRPLTPTHDMKLRYDAIRLADIARVKQKSSKEKDDFDITRSMVRAAASAA